jgi:hypothetical protein
MAAPDSTNEAPSGDFWHSKPRFRERQGEELHRGTREQLIATGLVQAGDFPGEPGGPVASRTYERDGRKFIVSINSRVANPITYWVRVTATNAEQRARRRAEKETEPESPAVRERRERASRIRAAIKAGEYLPLSREDARWYTRLDWNTRGAR